MQVALISLAFLLVLFSSSLAASLTSETVDLSSHAPLRILLDELPRHSNHSSGQFARNATDLYKGTWSLLTSGNCTPWPKFEKTSGTLTLEFKQRKTVSMTFDVVLGEISVRDGVYSTDKSASYELQGLYFYTEGYALLFANKDDAPALKDISAVLPTSLTARSALALFSDMRALMNVSSNATIPEYLMLGLQLRPLTSLDLRLYSDVSTAAKLRRPGRASPQLFFSALAISSNCSTVFNITGESYVFSVIARQALNYVSAIALLAFSEIMLLIRQMDYTESQSALMKVSLLAVGQQTVMDSYLCLIHLTVGVVFDDVFNAFAFAAFLKFIVFALFEMRYLMLIWKSRRPNTFDGWGGVGRELSQLYTRFYLGLLAGLLAFYFFGASVLLVFALYSFWVPQIWHTALRGERGGILPRYAFGVTFSRLFIPLYFYLCPSNLLHTKPRPYFGFILAGWMLLQTTVLAAQEWWGPRFFIPSRVRSFNLRFGPNPHRKFLPPRYEYHRPLQPSEQSNCVICMSLVVVAEPADYMVTPCGHLFHEPCLTQWMGHKLECPTCRTALPVHEER